MKSLYGIAMDLCRIRDSLGPVIKGEIRKGHASGSDLILEPGMRKTMLKDAREICEYQYSRLNTAANLLLEHDKLCRVCSKKDKDKPRGSQVAKTPLPVASKTPIRQGESTLIPSTLTHPEPSWSEQWPFG